jgi:hypothetical protein
MTFLHPRVGTGCPALVSLAFEVYGDIASNLRRSRRGKGVPLRLRHRCARSSETGVSCVCVSKRGEERHGFL